MSEYRYTILRPEVETTKELEERIANYARKVKVRLPRARRELIEKGVAVVETELSEVNNSSLTKGFFPQKVKIKEKKEKGDV